MIADIDCYYSAYNAGLSGEVAWDGEMSVNRVVINHQHGQG